MMSVASPKCRPLSVERKDKNHVEPGQKNTGEIPVLSHCSLLRNSWPKPTGVLEHCREGGKKKAVGFPFFGAFLSDSFPKGTTDVNAHLFIHASNSCKLYQRITGNFEANTYSICVHPCTCV